MVKQRRTFVLFIISKLTDMSNKVFRARPDRPEDVRDLIWWDQD